MLFRCYVDRLLAFQIENFKTHLIEELGKTKENINWDRCMWNHDIKFRDWLCMDMSLDLVGLNIWNHLKSIWGWSRIIKFWTNQNIMNKQKWNDMKDDKIGMSFLHGSDSLDIIRSRLEALYVSHIFAL